MGYNHERIKANGRTFTANNRGQAIVACLIYLLIIGAISGAVSGIVIKFSQDGENTGVTVNGFSRIIKIFFSNVFVMGFMGWFRKRIYSPLEPTEIFNVFKENYWGKVGTMVLRDLLVGLWSLLLIVPGIIKMYQYRMVEFIKEENPNIPAQRVLEISTILTNGHKMDLFVLDISFIGWHLLGAITFGIVEVVYSMPYNMASLAFAYEELKAEAAQAGKFDPAELTGVVVNQNIYYTPQG